ncbi:MAG: hypothetical protein ACR2KL_08545 [Nocardioidaceae bacterium]
MAVLEAAGYRVEVPPARLCCGLTLISTGQLDAARVQLRRTVAALAEPARTGTPLVGLEPSCTAVLRSDALHLLPEDPDASLVAASVRTLAEQLALTDGYRPPDLAGNLAAAQPHCHHAVVCWAGNPMRSCWPATSGSSRATTTSRWRSPSTRCCPWFAPRGRAPSSWPTGSPAGRSLLTWRAYARCTSLSCLPSGNPCARTGFGDVDTRSPRSRGSPTLIGASQGTPVRTTGGSGQEGAAEQGAWCAMRTERNG